MATLTMKGWHYTSQTQPPSLKLEEALTISTTLPAPTISSLSNSQLLIEVLSAAINPVDYKIYEAGGLVSKFTMTASGVPGYDFCGRVVATHAQSTSVFKTGDTVFGCVHSPAQWGSLAEKMIVDSENCALLPEGVSTVQGAAVGIAGIAAYISLPSATVKPGAKIFINDGSGGTGTWGIQLAKAMGAHVTTTCSTPNIELCKSLGADEVIDYKTCDILTVLGAKGMVFDLVVDNAGSPLNSNLYKESHRFLKESGEFKQVTISVNWTGFGGVLDRSLRLAEFEGGKRRFAFVSVKTSTEAFKGIGELMKEGRVKAVVHRVWEFEEVLEAFVELRVGGTRGKMVVRVGGIIE